MAAYCASAFGDLKNTTRANTGKKMMPKKKKAKKKRK